jgi:3-hydroxymyristoyl/3-hydroxydecanoyl-(acyl carrier protein) dehydratase
MLPERLAPLLRSWRRRPLWEPGPTTRSVQYGRAAIERILEHRDPFLFVDAITEVDLEERCLRGMRRVDARDPVFAGHFPGRPVYPAVLQLEIMGQMGLCLIHFCNAKTDDIASDAVPLAARALKVHHALFPAEVRPGDELTVLAKLLDADAYTVTCAGQLVRDGAICAVAVMEVYLVGDA